MGYTGEQKREYQRKWIAARRSEYFEDKSCAVCGSTDSLELDHKNPEDKALSPAALWSMSRDNPKRIAELAKCQVLCSEHHKEKTKAWWQGRRQHGRTMYAYGCKCEICIEAQRLHNAQRYAPKALR
jgi:5-methylcytosine-specific restriction endonuclease McrA